MLSQSIRSSSFWFRLLCGNTVESQAVWRSIVYSLTCTLLVGVQFEKIHVCLVTLGMVVYSRLGDGCVAQCE